MTTIQEDPKKFHTEDGGWSFLNPESDAEDEGNEDEESSEFDPEDAEGVDAEDAHDDDVINLTVMY